MRADHVHGTAVAHDARAVLILGRAGAGKSSLAFDLMAYGASLVADDRVRLIPSGKVLRAAALQEAPALIEARGVGLLPASLAGAVPLALVVDLDLEPAERLPRRRFWHRDGFAVPLIGPARPSVIWAALQAGGPVDPEAAIRS